MAEAESTSRNTHGVLVVGAETPAARAVAGRVDGPDLEVRATAEPERALEILAAGGIHVVVLDLALDGRVRDAVGGAAGRHGAVLLCSAEVVDEAGWNESLRLGARGLVRTADDVAGRVRGALELRRDAVARREELGRLRAQHDELKGWCSQQARSFQEAQETFFLDLSRMMTIIGNIMDGIVFADVEGNVSLLNPVAEDLLGVKAFLAIGKPVDSLEGCPEILEALAADHRTAQGRKDSSRTIEVHHSQQDLMYIKVQTSAVLDYRGQFAGILSVLEDVTAEYKSDQLKNQYLSIVAHELRTPLTGIKTFSTMMSKGALGELNDKQTRVMDSIREQSLRLEHQIDKLINLGHLDSNEYGQDLEVFDPAEFAQSVMAPFEQPAKDRDLVLGLEADDLSGLEAHADRSDLRRACQALVENAVKFTYEGGRVTIRLEREGDRVMMSVEDDGIGIDPRYHRRIFEKFFQVEDPLTRHHGGAGLGLFVAKGIVDAHGSDIVVHSDLGEGARFRFELPVMRIDSSEPEGADPATATKASTH